MLLRLRGLRVLMYSRITVALVIFLYISNHYIYRQIMSNADSGPSLRLVPGPASSNSISVSSTSHPVHAGVHDSMRHGQRNLATEVSSSSVQHPLQHRLESWDATRDNLKLTMQRNMFGMAAPIRTLMERRIVEHNPHFPALQAGHMGGGPRKGLSALHRDILNGDDETIDPVDFLPSAGGPELLDIHAQMERKHNI